MLLGQEITEPIDLGVSSAGRPVTISTAPQYVVKRAKRRYDKNICQVQHQVVAVVWHLIEGTKRVRHKVRKSVCSLGPDSKLVTIKF